MVNKKEGANKKNMERIKVRFNLGRGSRYMKWKVQYPAIDGNPSKTLYLDPNDVQLVMYNITLKNQKESAKKIYCGGNKRVCAWVLCETLDIKTSDYIDGGSRVSYNPRVTPNWVYNDLNADGMDMGVLVSNGRELYELKK